LLHTDVLGAGNSFPECAPLKLFLDSFCIGYQGFDAYTSKYFRDLEAYSKFASPIVSSYINVYANTMGNPRVLVFKYPHFALSFPEYIKYYRNIKCILVVRHPIAILRSQLTVISRQGGLINKSAINSCAKSIVSFYQNVVPSASLFLIKYEEMVDENVIQALRDFSSLPKISVDQLCKIDWGLARTSSSDPYLSDLYGKQMCIQGYSRQNWEHGDELLDHSISILHGLIDKLDYSL
jgi:hypothetical protein